MSDFAQLTGREAAEGVELAPTCAGNASERTVEDQAADRRRRHVLVGSVIGGVLALLLAWQYAGMGIARRVGVVPRQQHFTAVYFKYPTQLPRAVRVGRPVELTFVVDDREGAGRRYGWTVVLATGARTTRLAAGVIAVAAGRARQVTVAFDAPPVVGSAMVRVDVGVPAVGIDFHLRVLAPKDLKVSRIRPYPPSGG